MENLDPSILQMNLTLRSELVKTSSESVDRQVISVEDPVTGRLYELGGKEFQLLRSLSADKTIEEFLSEFPEQQPSTDCPPTVQSMELQTGFFQQDVYRIINWGLQKGILHDQGEAYSQYRRRNAFASKIGHTSRWLNWISFRIPFGCPENYFQKIAPKLKWIFHPGFFALWLIVCLWAASQFYLNWNRFWDQSAHVITDGGWLILLAVWVIIKIVHEMAHGIAAKKYSTHLRDCGVLFILFMPMAYVDITSSAKLPNRFHRIVIAAAGMYVEIFMAAVAFIVWASTENLALSQWSYAIVISAGLSTVLFNANPLMKFDGYFILSDLLNQKNLAENGKKWLHSIAGYILLGKERTYDQSASGWIVGSYGILAWAWRVLLNLTLLIGASALFYGFGILIAIGAVVAMYLIPTGFQIVQVFKNQTWKHWHVPNLVASGIVTSLALILAFRVISGPASIGSPAVVQFKDRAIVRSQSNGFLDAWKVQPGQWVEEGQILAVLENQLLQIQLKKLQLDVQQSRIQSKIFLQENELGQFKIEKRNLEKLQQDLRDHKQKVDGLTIRAVCKGKVPNLFLENQLGRFYSEGDKVLELIKQRKEVSISICQDDLPSLNRQVGQPVKLLLAGHRTISAKLDSIQPQASKNLIAESLSSTNGGPLSVKAANEDDGSDFHKKRERFVLAVPRITATVRIPDNLSDQLHLGQTGIVYFRSKKQSLGSYLYLGFHRYLRSKIEQAGL